MHAQKERQHHHDTGLIDGLKETLHDINDKLIDKTRDYNILLSLKKRFEAQLHQLRQDIVDNQADKTKANDKIKHIQKTYNDNFIDLQQVKVDLKKAQAENNSLAATNRYLYSIKDINQDYTQDRYKNNDNTEKDKTATGLTDKTEQRNTEVDLVTPPSTPTTPTTPPSQPDSGKNEWEENNWEHKTPSARDEYKEEYLGNYQNAVTSIFEDREASNTQDQNEHLRELTREQQEDNESQSARNDRIVRAVEHAVEHNTSTRKERRTKKSAVHKPRRPKPRPTPLSILETPAKTQSPRIKQESSSAQFTECKKCARGCGKRHGHPSAHKLTIDLSKE